MTICRWSNDDHQCDIYAYHDVAGGITVHVATSRYVFTEPLPEPVPYTPENIEAWFARHRDVMGIVRRSDITPIGLSRDGETYQGLTADEALDLLVSLHDEGYNVPESALDELRATT